MTRSGWAPACCVYPKRPVGHQVLRVQNTRRLTFALYVCKSPPIRTPDVYFYRLTIFAKQPLSRGRPGPLMRGRVRSHRDWREDKSTLKTEVSQRGAGGGERLIGNLSARSCNKKKEKTKQTRVHTADLHSRLKSGMSWLWLVQNLHETPDVAALALKAKIGHQFRSTLRKLAPWFFLFHVVSIQPLSDAPRLPAEPSGSFTVELAGFQANIHKPSTFLRAAGLRWR